MSARIAGSIRVGRLVLLAIGLAVLVWWALAPGPSALLRAEALSITTILLVILVLGATAMLRPFEYPQDFAFKTYAGFGPTLKLPKADRIRRKVWWASEEEIARWLADFEKLDAFIWTLAERGGSAKLGPGVVQDELQDAFPFLRYAGLVQAIFLVNYYAWHEGYDKA